MRTATKKFGPFGGLIKTANARYIPERVASDMCNLRCDNFAVHLRNGFERIKTITGITPNGFFYGQGYDSSNDPVEEFYVLDTSTGSTVITAHDPVTLEQVGAALFTDTTPLADIPHWWATSWRDKAIFTNGNTVYFHDIGDVTSWKNLNLGPAPNKPTITKTYPASEYDRMGWLGIDVTTDIIYTGMVTATGSVNVTTETQGLRIGFVTTGGSSQLCTLEIDLTARTAGVPDFRQADFFGLTMVLPRNGSINAESIRIKFVTSTPDEFEPEEHDAISSTAGPDQYHYWCRFEKEDRDEWTTSAPANLVTKIKISFEFTQLITVQQNFVDIMPLRIGGMDYNTAFGSIGNTGFLQYYGFAVEFYDTTLLLSTKMSDEVPVRGILDFGGHSPIPGLPAMGTRITLETNSTLNADQERWYIRPYGDGLFRRFHSQADTVAAWVWEPEPIVDPSELPIEEEFKFDYEDVAYIFPSRGSMVYLYNRPEKNIKMSAVGLPFKQYSVTDDPNNPALGEDFDMAPNFADAPIMGFDIVDSNVYFGAHAAYAHSGSMPRYYGGVKPIPNSPGILSLGAACTWQRAVGEVGAVYLDRYGESIWYVSVHPGFDGERNYTLIELSATIRGFVTEWLLTGQDMTEWSNPQVFTSHDGRDVWIMHGTRALVYHRQADGQAVWEPYAFNMGSNVRFAAYTPTYGSRIMDTRGAIFEMEWSSARGEYIAGKKRDDGGKMPTGMAYWESAIMRTPNARVHRVYRDTDDPSFAMSVTAYSTDQTLTMEFGADRRTLYFDPHQKGHEHRFRFTLEDDNSSDLFGVDIDLMPLGQGSPNA